MPTYELTSPKSGKTYKVEFASEPGEADIDDAIAHFDGQAVAPDSPSTPGALEQARLAAQTALGGIGRPVDPVVARQMAASRVLARNQQAGIGQDLVRTPDGGLGVQGGGALAGAMQFARRAASYPTFGLSEPALALEQKALLAAGLTTPEAVAGVGLDALDRQQPMAGAYGDLAGMAIPAGGTAAATTRRLEGTVGRQMYQAGKKGAVIGNVMGGTSGASDEAAKEIRSGEGVSASKVLAAGAIPAAIGTGIGAVGGAGSARLALRNKIPVTQATERFVDALEPRARALDPAKRIRAQQVARESVALILPDIPEMKAGGAKFRTAGDTLDAATAAKQKIFQQRAEMVGGTSEPVNGDVIANAIDNIVNDPVYLRQHGPSAMADLKAMAARYRGQMIDMATAERENQFFNASVEAKRAGLRNFEDAKLRKSDPSYAAGMDASAALKAELTRLLGGEFSELGRKYGAWAEISRHAESQKARQFILENRDSLPRWLAAFKMIGDLRRGDVGEALATGAMGEYMRYRGTPDAKFSRLDSALSSYAKWKASQPPRPTTPGLAMAARAQAVPPRPPPEPPAAPPMPPPVEPPPVRPTGPAGAAIEAPPSANPYEAVIPSQIGSRKLMNWKADYEKEMLRAEQGSWRSINGASASAKAAKVSPEAFVTRLRKAGYDDEKIMAESQSFNGKGFNQLELTVAMDRLGSRQWQEQNGWKIPAKRKPPSSKK